MIPPLLWKSFLRFHALFPQTYLKLFTLVLTTTGFPLRILYKAYLQYQPGQKSIRRLRSITSFKYERIVITLLWHSCIRIPVWNRMFVNMLREFLTSQISHPVKGESASISQHASPTRYRTFCHDC
jgi:hypothetical protein